MQAHKLLAKQPDPLAEYGVPRAHLFEVSTFIDVRDHVGKWLGAQVTRSDLKALRIFVHYLDWDPKWDEWIDMAQESFRVAEFRKYSSGGEPQHDYKLNEYVRVYHIKREPRQWTSGFIRKIDGNQVQVQYSIDNKVYQYWFHVATNEIARFVDEPRSDGWVNIHVNDKKSVVPSAPPGSVPPVPPRSRAPFPPKAGQKNLYPQLDSRPPGARPRPVSAAPAPSSKPVSRPGSQPAVSGAPGASVGRPSSNSVAHELQPNMNHSMLVVADKAQRAALLTDDDFYQWQEEGVENPREGRMSSPPPAQPAMSHALPVPMAAGRSPLVSPRHGDTSEEQHAPAPRDRSLTAGEQELLTLFQQLNVERYFDNFMAQEIEASDLLNLTEEDLLLLVPKIGPRRRLTQYIVQERAKLGHHGVASAALPVPVLGSVSSPASAGPVYAPPPTALSVSGAAPVINLDYSAPWGSSAQSTSQAAPSSALASSVDALQLLSISDLQATVSRPAVPVVGQGQPHMSSSAVAKPQAPGYSANVPLFSHWGPSTDASGGSTPASSSMLPALLAPPKDNSQSATFLHPNFQNSLFSTFGNSSSAPASSSGVRLPSHAFQPGMPAPGPGPAGLIDDLDEKERELWDDDDVSQTSSESAPKPHSSGAPLL